MTNQDAPSDFAGKTIVVLTPTFNDWLSVRDLLPLIDRAIASVGARGKVVVIDDGSTDDRGRADVPGLNLSAIESVDELALTRNQGNQRALAIGIGFVADRMTGDFLIVMDSDLEDDPKYIPDLLNRCLSAGGRSIVFAKRAERSEGLAFRAMYWLYRRLFRLFTGTRISVGNFSVIPWSLVPRLANVGELWSHFPAAIMRSRLPYQSIPIPRGRRLHGKSTMNTVPLIAHAFGGFTVHAEAFAVRALIAAIVLSGVIILTGLGLAALRLFTDIPITGWTSVIIGVLMIMLFQVISTAVNTLFLVLSLRTQTPMIPVQEYGRFIVGVSRLLGRPDA
jgi:glycosyltransferase involved in cell wall biosynthesis